MTDLLISSKEIIEKARSIYKPHATVMMFSGGNDSLTALHVAKELGIKIDYVLHGVTGTGIEETRKYVHHVVKESGHEFIEANAGDAYEKYVMRKGFFGRGRRAHSYAYHLLKVNPFRSALSKHIRKKTRGLRILLLNGARRKESDNRLVNMASPYRLDPAKNGNIWVSIINEWEKEDCTEYLSGNSIDTNPVSKLLCRSGECMCGTMQSPADRVEAKYHFPDWGRWLDDIERRVIQSFPWKWGEVSPKKLKKIKTHTQLDVFQPMCVSCVINEPAQ